MKVYKVKYLINSDELGRIQLIELTENRQTKDLISKDNDVFIAKELKRAVNPGKYFSFVIDDETMAHQIYDVLRSYKKHMAMCILNNITIDNKDEIFI